MILLLAAAFVAALVANTLRPSPPAPVPRPKLPESGRLLGEMRGKSNAELRAELARLFEPYRRGQAPMAFEACLCAIVERADVSWYTLLRDMQGAMELDDDRRRDNTPRQFELMTAANRMNGYPDALTVTADAICRQCRWPDLPMIDATVHLNVRQRIPVGNPNDTPRFRLGNFRPGDRWRVEVIDGGGAAHTMCAQLEPPGASADTRLSIANDYGVVSPGRCRLHLLLSEHRDIANAPSLDGLIVYRSAAIEVEVLPRIVRPSRRERDVARAAIALLPEGAAVGVVRSYDAICYRLIPPDTSRGVLMGLGWNAVPDLLEALLDRTATVKRRAWLLALLWAITGVHHPWMATGYAAETAIGDFEFFARTGSMEGMELATAGVHRARISREAQDNLIVRWRICRRYIVVEEPVAGE